MSRLNSHIATWLAVVAVVGSIYSDNHWPEVRKSHQTIVFVCLTTSAWLIGRALRLNRTGVWPAVVAVGSWVHLFVPASWQEVFAIGLPLGALAGQSLPRIRERRIWTMLVGYAATCAVVWLRSSYYLSAELLFLAGVWCVVTGYGLFDVGGEAASAEPADATASTRAF